MVLFCVCRLEVLSHEVMFSPVHEGGVSLVRLGGGGCVLVVMAGVCVGMLTMCLRWRWESMNHGVLRSQCVGILW